MAFEKSSHGFAHLVLLLVIILAIGAFILLNHSSKTITFPPLSPTPTDIEQQYEQQRSAEFQSPDGKHIAYTEDSPETITRTKERDSQGYGFVEGSTNVWVMNVDGTNKTQVTNHEGFVQREIIKWIDNNTLIYLDGDQSLRKYTLSTKKITTIFGSEGAIGSCVDACSYSSFHMFSPDKTYFIQFFLGTGSPDNTIRVLNMKNMEAFPIENKENGDCMTGPTFSNDATMTFTNSPLINYGCDSSHAYSVIVDLEGKKTRTER